MGNYNTSFKSDDFRVEETQKLFKKYLGYNPRSIIGFTSWEISQSEPLICLTCNVALDRLHILDGFKKNKKHYRTIRIDNDEKDETKHIYKVELITPKKTDHQALVYNLMKLKNFVNNINDANSVENSVEPSGDYEIVENEQNGKRDAAESCDV